jgi:23S rRNA pseudouridine2605 synthase
VAIERGKPGSDRVRTSPARIRQVRQGDNPWYEVVLIEGRNRELRKMFEEIGHFVEKIRRVGYGPLILDQEPGNLRELDAQELILLRKAADGTLRTPKSKEIRRRNLIDALPPEKPAFRPKPPRSAEGSKDYRPKRAFENRSGEGRTRDDRPRETRGRELRTGEPRSGGFRTDTGRPAQPDRFGGDNLRSIRPAGRDFGPSRPAWKKDARPAAGNSYRDKTAADRHPYAGKPAGEQRLAPKPAGGRPFGDRPSAEKTYAGKPGFGKSVPGKPPFRKSGFGKPAPGKPAWPSASGSDRPPFKPPVAPRRQSAPARDEDFGPVRPPNLHIEEIHEASRPPSSRPSTSRPYAPRPNAGRSSSSRPNFNRPKFDRPSRPREAGSDAPYERSSSGRSSSGPGRSSAGRPFRPQSGLARPFTTSSGKPRAGGARPSSKPGDRSSSGGWKPGRPGGGSRSAPGGSSGERPAGKTGWKPRPGSGGFGRPSSGGHSKSGYKGKSPGSGARSFGKRPGGPSGGGKRRG